MIVAIDTSVLLYMVDPNVPAPIDPETAAPVTRCYERVMRFIEDLSRSKTTLLIPTPSLAELLVHADTAASQWVARLSQHARIEIQPFDTRAAVEHAAQMRGRRSRGSLGTGERRSKVKFDEQIIAIAQLGGASLIYSDDGDIRKLAKGLMEVRGIADLPEPEDDRSPTLFDYSQPE